MKSLYESILGSTKSGAYELIKKWCDKVCSRGSWDDVERGYMIDANLCITNWTNGKSNNALYINSNYNEKVPDYIKFAKEINANFFVGQLLNLMDHNNLPDKVQHLYISGLTKRIPSFKIEAVHGISINDHAKQLEHIDPIELHCYTIGHHGPLIDLNETKVEIDDIKNIKVIGDVYTLRIQNTPASETIKKEIKKYEKKAGVVDKNSGQQPAWAEYANELFVNMPGLRYVELSSRTQLERSPRTGIWFKL